MCASARAHVLGKRVGTSLGVKSSRMFRIASKWCSVISGNSFLMIGSNHSAYDDRRVSWLADAC